MSKKAVKAGAKQEAVEASAAPKQIEYIPGNADYLIVKLLDMINQNISLLRAELKAKQ